MSTSVLHIFKKDSNANASIAGFQFQILKTLEIWIQNLINGIDEKIYCDYENDIFQKNVRSKTMAFTQIKLYSRNFSFKSAEIRECLADFFILHHLHEHNTFAKHYIFETNTQISANRLNNEAELLRQWAKSQNELPDELLMECAIKTKSLVIESLKSRSKQISKKRDPRLVQEALDIIENIDSNGWIEFTRAIRWNFSEVKPEIQLSRTIDTIKSLLGQVPLPIELERIDSIFCGLHRDVSIKSSNIDPENRVLNRRMLESYLIRERAPVHKWYDEIYENWYNSNRIPPFSSGESFEILEAARHCRRNHFLAGHIEFWIGILQSIEEDDQSPPMFRDRAAYEIIWLNIRPINIYSIPEGDLFGCEQIIYKFLSNIESRVEVSDLENVQNILQILYPAIITGRTKIGTAFFYNCTYKLLRTLFENLRNTVDTTHRCRYLLLIGTYRLQTSIIRDSPIGSKAFSRFFHRIISLSGKALLFNVSEVATTMNHWIKILIIKDPINCKKHIQELEYLAEKLDPIIGEREGKYRSARIFIDRGSSYLETGNHNCYLTALENFHRAMSLLFQSETLDGFVLCLINIAQIYSRIGMNYAAKYYALGAIWNCAAHPEKAELRHRHGDAIAMLFEANFHQGDWITALQTFSQYYQVVNEYGFDKNPTLQDETLQTISKLYTLILYYLHKKDKGFRKLVHEAVASCEKLGDLAIKPLWKNLEEIDHQGFLNSILLQYEFSGKLISDSEAFSAIEFQALGGAWKIHFENQFETRSLVEEFCAIVQVTLSEIGRSNIDFHLLRNQINVSVEISQKFKEPIEKQDSTGSIWILFLSKYEGTDVPSLTKHTSLLVTAAIKILNSQSLLPLEEFKFGVRTLLENNSLLEKVMSVNSYQVLFNSLCNDQIPQIKHETFSKELDKDDVYPKCNKVLFWNQELSTKYNKESAIKHIENRFVHSKRYIHTTLKRLRKSGELPVIVNNLRSSGWLDWQIVLGMMNFVLGYKSRSAIENMRFSSQAEYDAALLQSFDHIKRMDEKDWDMEFPADAFSSSGFKLSLSQYVIFALDVIGLQINTKFPNLEAIKEFLDIRFNMQNDTTDNKNPFRDIPFSTAEMLM